VKLQVRSWHLVIRVLVLALAVAAVPLPTFAGETSAPIASKPTLTGSIQRAVAVTPLAPARGQAAGAKADKTELASPSFFKTKAGVLALVVLAVGAGYTVYSSQHDRIHSTARK
jgi:hypothetical protein